MAKQKTVARSGNGGAQLRKHRTTEWTTARRRKFLAILAETANVHHALREVGMSSSGVYKLKKRDGAFRAAWIEALHEGYARMELLLLQHAFAGLEPIEVPVGTVSTNFKMSERGMLSLLQYHRQEVRDYRQSEGRTASDARAEDATIRKQLLETLAQMGERMAADENDAA